jgi:hypothetical protein
VVLVNVATGTWGEGVREVAEARRSARRGTGAALVVSVVGIAGGVALDLPRTFLVLPAGIGLVALWRVLDPGFSERVSEVWRLLKGKPEEK